MLLLLLLLEVDRNSRLVHSLPTRMLQSRDGGDDGDALESGFWSDDVGRFDDKR